MTARVPLREKIAGAIPFLVLIAYCIAAVFTSKLSTELLKFDAVWLFRVAPGFLDLSDKTGLHSSILNNSI